MPKLSERRNMSPEELKNDNNAYYRAYYAKNKDKVTFQSSKKTKPSIIENNINRLLRDDEYIKMFIDRVGNDKILELMGNNKE
jgi:hypothetical protein